MKKWRAVCLDGFTIDLMAETRLDAVGKLLTSKKLKKHINAKHPEWKEKTFEQKIQWVVSITQLII